MFSRCFIVWTKTPRVLFTLEVFIATARDRPSCTLFKVVRYIYLALAHARYHLPPTTPSSDPPQSQERRASKAICLPRPTPHRAPLFSIGNKQHGPRVCPRNGLELPLPLPLLQHALPFLPVGQDAGARVQGLCGCSAWSTCWGRWKSGGRAWGAAFARCG